MAEDHFNLSDFVGRPLSPEVQAAEDARIKAWVDSLPDASGTFSGHMVTDACYGPNGCTPGCPVPADVMAEALDMENPN